MCFTAITEQFILSRTHYSSSIALLCMQRTAALFCFIMISVIHLSLQCIFVMHSICCITLLAVQCSVFLYFLHSVFLYFLHCNAVYFCIPYTVMRCISVFLAGIECSDCSANPVPCLSFDRQRSAVGSNLLGREPPKI